MKRKRIISTILAIGMVLSLLPTPAYAADMPTLAAEDYGGVHAAHTNCGEGTTETVTDIDRLDEALGGSATDVVLNPEGDDVVWTTNASFQINGTKHLYVAEGKSVTIKRTGNGNSALFTVASGATLILGSGTLSYDNTGGRTLTAAAQGGAYTVEQSGGELIIDGGAVWTKNGAYTRGTAFSNTDGTQAIFHDLTENGATYGQQFYYNNTGATSTASIISNSGTLNIWPGVTLQNNAKTGDGYGAAIYCGASGNNGSYGSLNMYGGTVKMCVASGSGGYADRGLGGAIYLGNTGVGGSSKNAPLAAAAYNMYGGSVLNNGISRSSSYWSNNSIFDGGGICLDQATMNLYGGSVSYNHSGVNAGRNGSYTFAGDGGGIMVRCGSVLNMWGGSVDHNFAGGYGGGVVAWNADINIHGGSITQNTASFGAGIGIAADNESGSVVNMSGGTVAHNEAITFNNFGGYGGGICAGSAGYPEQSRLNLSGGTILQNKAQYGGGIAVYADEGTYANLYGNFEMTGNFANYHGNGMYLTNTNDSGGNPANNHALVRLSGGARVDTNNPVYFHNVCTGQTPVQVTGGLTTAGTAAIFEFSDAFWNGPTSNGYVRPNANNPLPIVKFDAGLDVQENKIALESSTWYLQSNTANRSLDLRSFSNLPQYTIRNGTPVEYNDRLYYKLYSNLTDAFNDAQSGDTLYIFYNTTITTPAVVAGGKSITLLAESTSSAAIDGMLANGTGSDYSYSSRDGYNVMSGSFILYGRDSAPTPYSYNVRNDYTITLSSTLFIGEGGKQTSGGAPRQAAIVVEDGASLSVGQVAVGSIGTGSLVFDGNLSYPKEGPMFRTSGSLTMHSGITVKNHSNWSEAHPGAIEVADGGSFTMNDGVTISGNVSPVAGAVYVAQGGAFTMNGGEISGNKGAMPRYGFETASGTKFGDYDTAYWGQAKYYHGSGGVLSDGTFTLNGGSVTSNCGEYGGVASMRGNLLLHGGTITGNHAHTGQGTEGDTCDLTITGYADDKWPTPGDGAADAGSGGGVFVGNGSANVEINKVRIADNTAEKNGGGIAVGTSESLVRPITGYVSAGTSALETISLVQNGSLTTATVTARVPNYGTNTVSETNDFRVAIASGEITDNTAGEMGGGVYNNAAAWVDIAAGTTLSRNTARYGGGIAANGEDVDGEFVINDSGAPSVSGAVIAYRNEITGNTATVDGGGVYAREGSAIVLGYGDLTSNVAARNGGGAALDDSGVFVLLGAFINNNRLSGDGSGVGVYSNGTLSLSAVGGKQPFVSYNDVIYLAQGRTVRVDATYKIEESSQSAGNKLTVDSAVSSNGTDIFTTASEGQAENILKSNCVAHLSGSLSMAKEDTSIIEINSVFITYWDAEPGTGDATGSTFSEAPNAKGVLARSFVAAGTGPQGNHVEGFEVPDGQLLTEWVLAREATPTDNTEADFVYLDKDFDVVDKTAAASYEPGDELDLTNGDFYLIAEYAVAEYYVYYQDMVNGAYTDGVQNGLPDVTADNYSEDSRIGGLMIPNADYISVGTAKRYAFAQLMTYEDESSNALVITPTPVVNGDLIGVLKSFDVYSQVDTNSGEGATVHIDEQIYDALGEDSIYRYYLDSAEDGDEKWIKTFTAHVDSATGRIIGITAYEYTVTDNDGTPSVQVTELGGEDAATVAVPIPTAAGAASETATATVSADGRSITYNQPPDSILVMTEFVRANVELRMTTHSGEHYTGYFKTHHDAFGEMIRQYNTFHGTDQLFANVKLLAEYKGSLENADPVDGTNGIVDMAMSGQQGEIGISGINYTLDLNGFTMDMGATSQLKLDGIDATIKNGAIRQSTNDDTVDFAFTISAGDFTVENVTIVTHPSTKYGIDVGTGGKLHIKSGCKLGNIFLEEGEEDRNDAVAAVEAAFDTTRTDYVATIFLGGDSNNDGVWDYGNGERRIFELSNVSTAKGSEIRRLFELGDPNAPTGDEGNADEWFIGTDGMLYKKVKYVEPWLSCGSDHGNDIAAVLEEINLGDGDGVTDETDEIEPVFNESGYPVFHAYRAQYGFNSREHLPQFNARLLDAQEKELEIDNGTVRFLINEFDGTTSNRLYGTSAGVDDGIATMIYSDISRADATEGENPYVVSVSWYGDGEYASQYANYWNYNYNKQPAGEDGNSFDGINGAVISGVATLELTKKPIKDASVVLEYISPSSAEYIGPAGREAGYTSVPSIGSIRDVNTDRLLISGTAYTGYYIALTTDAGEAVASEGPFVHSGDGKSYYYLADANGDKIYYTNNGANAMTGVDIDNALPLNGAPAGVYSAELASIEGTNYSGLSGWKDTIFTITPYSGRLRVAAENYVVAKGATTVGQFRAAIEAAYDVNTTRPVTDDYGNVLKRPNYSIRFEELSSTATLERGWPASAGLYNVVVTADGHGTGTLIYEGVSTELDPNYSTDSVGYMAMLITTEHLGVFVIPETVTVPYTGSIYTDTEVKKYDSSAAVPTYEIWKVDIDEATGAPLNKNGGTIDTGTPAGLESIKTLGQNAVKLDITEYRLELGTPQHVPRDADTYTMIVTDTTGSYSGIGHLEIAHSELSELRINADGDTAYNESDDLNVVYTAQGHMPNIVVTDTDGHVLTPNTDYILTVRPVFAGADGEIGTADDTLGNVIVTPRAAGTYRYTADGINNYSGRVTKDYTVVPKNIANIDETEFEVTYDAVTEVFENGAAIIPNISLYYNGSVLSAGTDYTLEYDSTAGNSNIIDPGTYPIKVKGLGNFGGEFSEFTYDLIVRSLTEAGSLHVTSDGRFTYNGDNFASHGWLANVSMFYGDDPLDATRCDIIISTDLDGVEIVTSYSGEDVYSKDNRYVNDPIVLNAGNYFVRFTPPAAYRAELAEKGTHLSERDYGIATMQVARASVTVTFDNMSKTYGKLDSTSVSDDNVGDTLAYTTTLLEPVAGEEATDPRVNPATGFYYNDNSEIGGSFTRDPGEDVRNTGYIYLLGSFTAGDNYNLAVNTQTRFRINSKRITAPDAGQTDEITVNYDTELDYTGYGQSPIRSVVYNPSMGLGSFTLSEGAHYIAHYDRWECDTHDGMDANDEQPDSTNICTPDTCDKDGTWESMTVMPADVGWYRVTLDADSVAGAANNYVGKRGDIIFHIAPTDDALTVQLDDSSVTYTGTAHTPTVTVLSGGFNLAASNYILSYNADYRDSSKPDATGKFDGTTEFIDAGTYTIYVTGTGNYAGATGSATFTIEPKSVAQGDTADGTDPVEIALVPQDFYYNNGEPLSADVTASYSCEGHTDILGSGDYSLAYSSHTNAGTAQVTLSGSGNYTGSRTLEYEIKPLTLSVTVNETEKVFGNLDPTFTYTLAYGLAPVTGVTLTDPVERDPGEEVRDEGYAFRLDPNSAGANYNLVLDAGQSFKITPKPIGVDNKPADRISVSMPTYVADTATAIDVAVTYWAETGTKTLANGGDYEVRFYTSNDQPVEINGSIELGSYYALITAVDDGNYTGSVKVEFEVVEADSFLTVEATPSTELYAGSDGVEITLTARRGAAAVTPGYSVVGPNGVTPPVANGRFTAVDVGTYVVTATDGTSVGSATVTIMPRPISDSAIIAKPIGEKSYTGGAIVLTDAELNELLTYKDDELVSNENFIATYTNNVQPTNGQATAQVTLHGMGNYTGVRTLTFAIGETRYTVTYHANGGSGDVPKAPDPGLFAANTNTVAASGSTLSRAGAIFYGWSTQQVAELVDDESKLPAVFYRAGHSITISSSDITLYAIWAADNNGDGTPDIDEERFRVNYMAGSGTGVAPTDNTLYLPKAMVSVMDAETLEKEKYALIGWHRDSEMLIEDAAEYLAAVANFTPLGGSFLMPEENVTLFPVWGTDGNDNDIPDWLESGKAFYIYYDGNGGVGSFPPTVLGVGDLTVDVSGNVFERTDYVQVGWTTNGVAEGTEASAHPATVSSVPTPDENGIITVDGVKHVFVELGGSYGFEEEHANPIIFYALWAEDKNNNDMPDYNEIPYSVSYVNALSSVTATMPTDSGRYYAGLPITLAGEQSGTYTDGGSTENAVFLGWTQDRTVASRLYARGEQPVGTVYAAGQTILAPSDDPTAATATLTFYALWGDKDHDTPATLAVDAPDTVTYNGEAQPPVLSVMDLNTAIDPNDYAVSYAKDGTAISGEPTDAGIYTVTVSGRAGTKYEGRSATVFYTINPAELTITPANATKTYGTADPTIGYNVSGRPQSGAAPTFDGALTRAAGENIGSYGIVLATLRETSGNYTLALAEGAAFTITQKNIADTTAGVYDVIIAEVSDRVVTNTALEPELTIVYPSANGTLALAKTTDYTVTYTVNAGTGASLDGEGKPLTVGTYTATVTGTGNYSGTRTVEFEIVASGLEMTERFNKTYNGTVQELTSAELDVRFGSTPLTLGTDYTVGYTVISGSSDEPEDVGAYTVTVTGIGTYAGRTASGTLVISPAVVDSVVTDPAENIELTYDGNPLKPEILLVRSTNGTADAADDINLNAGDYDVTYSRGGIVFSSPMADVGSYTLIVTGKGNFTGSVSVPYMITSGKLSIGSTVEGSVYDGMPYRPKPSVVSDSVTLVENTHYTLGYSGASIDAGDYTVTVTGIGNFVGGSAAAPYTIAPKALDNSDGVGEVYVTVADTVYTGVAQTPTVVVTYRTEDGRTLYLVEDTDYTVAYANNTNVGTATVTITAKSGNYAKSATANFRILPASDKSFEVSNPDSKTYNGEEQKPNVTVKAGAAELVEDRDYTVTYHPIEGTDAKLGANGLPLMVGAYTVNVVGKDGTDYEGYAGAATFIITPVQLTELTLTPTTSAYTGGAVEPTVTVKAGDATVDSEHYDVEYSNNVNAGTATVTVVGKGGCNGVLSATFVITKAPLTIVPDDNAKVFGKDDPTLEYTVKSGEQTVSVTLTGALTRAGGEDVGTYAYSIASLHDPSGNYELTLDGSKEFEITAKDITDNVVSRPTTLSVVGTDFTGPIEMVYDSDRGDLLLVMGTDYTLSYTDPLSVGDNTITVKAVENSNYTGEYTFTLNVSGDSLDASLDKTYATYDGASYAERIGFRVTDENDDELVNGTDYTYTVSPDTSITDVGAHTFNVTGKANYADQTDSVTFFVYAKDIADKSSGTDYDITITGITDPVTYNGSAHTPTPKLTHGTKTLALGSDYTVAYSNNVNAGDATVTVNGIGNYTGTRVVEFTIKPAELSIEAPADTEYNAKPQILKPTVTSGGRMLRENVDYTLSYSENTVDAGTVTVTVAGIGNYTAGADDKATYDITQRSITKATVNVIPAMLTYSGAANEPTVTVYDEELGMMLVAGRDFTVRYAAVDGTGASLDGSGKPLTVGEYTITITGEGNYTDTTMTEFSIAADVTGLSASVDPETATYDGMSKTPTLTVKSGENDATYTATYSFNGGAAQPFDGAQFVDVGVYVISVTGTDSYDGSVGTAVFTITPGRFTVSSIPDQEYTGGAITPKPTVRNTGDSLLTEAEYNDATGAYSGDYVLSYANNVEPGRATVTVTGIGNYAGCSTTVSFTIYTTATLTVTYDPNGADGGTVPTDESRYSLDREVIVKGGEPTKGGAVFLGWVIADTAPATVTGLEQLNAVGTVYKANSSFTIKGDTTLYALWAADEDGDGRPDYDPETFTIISSASGGTIEPSGVKTVKRGETVTYTITDANGYTLSELKVDGVAVAISSLEKSGSSYTYTFANVTSDHTISAAFSKTVNIGGGGGGNGGGGGGNGGGGTPTPTPNPVTPPDDGGSTQPTLIRDKHFAYVQGKGAGFDPNGTMTRAEVATILVRLMTGEMEIPTGYTTSFPDVAPDAWYHDAIAYLEQFGILKGYPDGTFRPTNPITRAEFAALMMRFFEVEEWTGEPIFSDLPETHWAYDYINSAHAYGFVLGYTDGTFAPDQYIRRAEAVALINRVLERVADRVFIDAHIASLVTYPDVESLHWAYYDIIEASNGHDFTYDYGEEDFGDEEWLGIWEGNVPPGDSTGDGDETDPDA